MRRPNFQGVIEVLKTYIAAKTQLDDLKDRLSKDISGASLVEYSVLIGIITVATVATIGLVGGWVGDQWTALDGALPDPPAGG